MFFYVELREPIIIEYAKESRILFDALDWDDAKDMVSAHHGREGWVLFQSPASYDSLRLEGSRLKNENDREKERFNNI